MHLKNLQLTNYRNFAALSLQFERKGALITGENGIGKSNLLESVYYLAFGRSFRTSQDNEIIHFDDSYFRISAQYQKDKKTVAISAAADKKSKMFKINDQPLERLSELFSHFQAVYFSPADIQIISGSPSIRRMFLDQAISQYDQDYLFSLRQYRQILRQRNALLKSTFSKEEKNSWDSQFVQSAEVIYNKRLSYLHNFSHLFKTYYKELLNIIESVNLNYVFSHVANKEIFEKDEFVNTLKRMEKQEIILQRTLIGPHLDDLEFLIEQKKARSFASQGQMRSLSIIARITQALMISKDSQSSPVLMFDDVLAELDSTRRESILALLKGRHQVLIATPDLDVYKSLDLPVIDLKVHTHV